MTCRQELSISGPGAGWRDCDAGLLFLRMGKWIIYAGLLLVVVGAILQFAPGALSWFGRLPGDIRIETAGGRVFIPITSMLLVSIVLSLLFSLFRR